MNSKITNGREENKDEKKSGVAVANTGKMKQLYDKTTTMKKTYSNVNNARNKASKGYRWFESDRVRPISTTQQPPNQTAANTVSPV